MTQEKSQFDKEMDAMSTVYALRPGHVLTQADYEAIQLFDKVCRDQQELANQAFHRGYKDAIRHYKGVEFSSLVDQIDSMKNDIAAARLMRRLAEEKLKEMERNMQHQKPKPQPIAPFSNGSYICAICGLRNGQPQGLCMPVKVNND